MNTSIIKKISSVLALSGIGFAGLSLDAKDAAAAGWYNCIPNSVFEWNGELEVECANAYSGTITWIGATVSTLTDKQEERFVSWATAAILSGRRFRVYMSDTACPAAGANCRIATAWSLIPAP